MYEYRNRKGDLYLLQQTESKTGKPRYYFGRNMKGTPVEEIPDGYEVYEKPDTAQVYCRKAKPTAILPVEKEIVSEAVERLSPAELFLVDVEPDSLVVYLPNTDRQEARSLANEIVGDMGFFARRVEQAVTNMVSRSQFHKAMRFSLADKDQRLFEVERWCFRGSIDDWIYLDGPAELSDLVEKFTPHLGDESFYELM